MRAILIDPFACTVSEIDFKYETYESLYPVLSHEAHPVDIFTVAPCELIGESNELYVDDEGLLHGPQRGFGFKTGNNPQLLAGKGLILGTDENGDSTDTDVSLETIVKSTVFYEFLGPMISEVSEPWEKPVTT